MGIGKVIEVILIAKAQDMGFQDGFYGRPVHLIFTDGFPQDNDKARAYHKGYEAGQNSRRLQVLNKNN